jgi:hypothetical protein
MAGCFYQLKNIRRKINWNGLDGLTQAWLIHNKVTQAVAEPSRAQGTIKLLELTTAEDCRTNDMVCYRKSPLGVS